MNFKYFSLWAVFSLCVLLLPALSTCGKKVWLVKDRKLWAWKIYYIVFSYRLSGRSKTIIWLIKFLQTTDARTRMSSICIVKNQRGQGYSWWKKYLKNVYIYLLLVTYIIVFQDSKNEWTWNLKNPKIPKWSLKDFEGIRRNYISVSDTAKKVMRNND